MGKNSSLNKLPIGLLELDAQGTVVYFKPDREHSSVFASDLIGRNLFTDITPIAEASEFQARIKSFKRSPAPADNFNFTFNLNHACLYVKVLLARIHEQSILGSTESVLIHIRPQADTKIAA